MEPKLTVCLSLFSAKHLWRGNKYNVFETVEMGGLSRFVPILLLLDNVPKTPLKAAQMSLLTSILRAHFAFATLEIKCNVRKHSHNSKQLCFYVGWAFLNDRNIWFPTSHSCLSFPDPLHRDCPLDCKVYVGNLGNNGNKTELERAFGYYGPLRSVWVARNPPGFAFVEFEDPRDASDAVRELDGRWCRLSFYVLTFVTARCYAFPAHVVFLRYLGQCVVVECVLNCPLARNALEAAAPHRPGVGALEMIIGGAVLQSDAGMYFWFFRRYAYAFGKYSMFFSNFKPFDTFF